jgi:hypothetical protein
MMIEKKKDAQKSYKRCFRVYCCCKKELSLESPTVRESGKKERSSGAAKRASVQHM